jgi:hypothetical protein
LRGFWDIVAFFEKNGLDYSLVSDEYIHKAGLDPISLHGTSHIVFGPHAEYWTSEMLDAADGFVNRGGKVIIAGGNTAFFEIEKHKKSIVRKQHFARHDLKNLFGASIGELAEPKYAPYEVVKSEHWVFEGIGLSVGDAFGEESLNHDGESAAKGASGWEADQIIDPQNNNVILLAKGKNVAGRADMVLVKNPSGGWVFNASSIPFAGALKHDKVIQKIMKNLLNN